MSLTVSESLAEALKHVQGYIYPNDLNLWWGALVVLYPYITGLVAGAFILASLVRVFHVKALEPTYRFSLLTALAFLLVAPLPLLFHLGHPERCYEVLMTPHLSSPMAVFGFVYAWYLMAVLLLELWFDYRKNFVEWAESDPNILRRFLYRVMTLGVTDVSERSLQIDNRLGQTITVVGIPSAFLLHGYVGFIFGSIKANPWWGTVLMPIIFIFSAMVSGIALMGLLYQTVSKLRKAPISMDCVDAITQCLFFAMILDSALEALDWIHRLYEAEESIDVLVLLAAGKLFYSFLLIQVLAGTLAPLVLLAVTIIFSNRLSNGLRRVLNLVSCLLVLVGVFAMRWNVVIGGQLFSKSLRGFTTYKLGLIGNEGLLMALALMILPFIILGVLVFIFRPWGRKT